MSPRATLSKTFLLVGLVMWGLTFGDSDFLAPEQAFHFQATAEADRIIVTWTIAPGYFLYRERLRLESTTAAIELSNPTLPKGGVHSDEFFGPQEIYRGTVSIPVSFSVFGNRPPQLELKLKWQGCADGGICYPPTTWTADVPLPASHSQK